MDATELARFLVILSVVVLPAMAITVRFALKPVLDAILRLKEGGVLPSATASVTAEVQQLREEVAELHRVVAGMQEADAFHRALTEGAGNRVMTPLQGPIGLP
jgi:hypothetical protein